VGASRASAVLGRSPFYLPPHAGRKGRHVVQELCCLRVCLPEGKRGRFEVTALLAREIDPPAGEKALEWRLLSNRAAPTLAEAATLIDWYRCRWEIELFFNILKNGCQVEALQMSTLSRIELALVGHSLCL
jgi:hypothetical protein